MNVQAFKKGDLIFREGDPTTEVYKVVDGAVDVIVDFGTEKQQFLITKQAGAFMGEFAGMFHEPRSATAIASTDCTLEAYSVEELLGEETFNYDFVETVLKLMITEVDDALRDYAALDRPNAYPLPQVTEECKRAYELNPDEFMDEFKLNIDGYRLMYRALTWWMTGISY